MLVEDDELVCLFTLSEGHSERSFALNIAQLAGVPEDGMGLSWRCVAFIVFLIGTNTRVEYA